MAGARVRTGPRSTSTVRETPMVGWVELNRRMMSETPARISDFLPPAKLRPDQTPYRSRMFVLARHSADGNAYSPGDPIPEAEAIRQGFTVERTGGQVYEPELKKCPKCQGTGKARKMKGHKPGCGCPGCLPCKVCGGHGSVVSG